MARHTHRSSPVSTQSIQVGGGGVGPPQNRECLNSAQFMYWLVMVRKSQSHSSTVTGKIGLTLCTVVSVLSYGAFLVEPDLFRYI
jgi:hypothetical protein